jgi:hypothetical protein
MEQNPAGWWTSGASRVMRQQHIIRNTVTVQLYGQEAAFVNQ